MTKRTLMICVLTIMVLTFDFTVSGSLKGNVVRPNTVEALERDVSTFVSELELDTVAIPDKSASGDAGGSQEYPTVVKRVEDHTIQEIVAYKTECREDETLPIGETRILQAGRTGIVDVKYRDYYENDVFVGTETVSREISTDAISEILRVGTQEGMVEPLSSMGALDLELAQAMFEQINTERRNAGLPTLQWSATLYDYATIRAREVKVKFAHDRPDGSSWDSLNPDLIYGENLATRAFSVEAAMQGFMNSPTHRENILSPFPNGAVAVFRYNDEEWFWVQLYGY